jgi:putative addiction module component (TIGR02574 family)
MVASERSDVLVSLGRFSLLGRERYAHERNAQLLGAVSRATLVLMAQQVPNPPPGFDALSVDEKIDYVEALWESIVERSSIPIPDWHRELVAERLEAYRAEPSAGRPWAEVRAELQRKYLAPPGR